MFTLLLDLLLLLILIYNVFNAIYNSSENKKIDKIKCIVFSLYLIHRLNADIKLKLNDFKKLTNYFYSRHKLIKLGKLIKYPTIYISIVKGIEI